MTSMEFATHLLAWAAIVSGSIFLIIGAIGTVRFPDFWSRLHAVSVTDSAGMILLTVGMMIHSGLTLVTVKLLIIFVFLFITGPTATHAVANAALVSGLLPKGIKPPQLEKKNTRTVSTKVKKARTKTKAKTAKRGKG